ncbi:uncharacterized protein LOC112349396 isoform X1 [Selaginella moellendorffii]|nr:uncharacterized protein LOC112349396 isoform X1 [Selaginella moellendorffii]|eukprot:XP_024539517.1 uncharacterized protein LOC112349396 isoform X1 [Selaginella moellendorffii]
MSHTPGAVINDPSVPPDLWTEQMLRAWKHAIDAAKHSPRDKKFVNLDDLLEVTDHTVRLSSPRSLQACLHLGIDPSEVVYRPMDTFAERGMRREFQQIKYDHHETQRREKLQRLKEERERLIRKSDEDKSRASAASEKRRKGGGDRDLMDRVKTPSLVCSGNRLTCSDHSPVGSTHSLLLS